jgi:small subunit ribosomal protein S4
MRYTGPKWRINRREGATVLGATDKWKRRPSLPGQFPMLKKKISDYGIQFREKQKVKRTYGMSEKQFKNLYLKALKFDNSSLKLLQLLEQRLDNVVYRLGFAETRAQARQFVTHGHIKLNGKAHNIPSTMMKSGDEVEFKDSIAASPIWALVDVKTKMIKVPAWLTKFSKSGKVVAEPTRDDIDSSIKERLIIELYSR